MKKQIIVNLIIILIALSPLGYLFLIWNKIPEIITTKFEINESFTQSQSKDELMTVTIILSLVSVSIYMLMRNLKRVDPKVTDITPKSSFHKIGLIITLFIVTGNYFLILSAKNDWTITANTAIAFFGLLVVLIGNYMNNIKPNYFAGIRLPWTLNDHENWRKTHQLAGKVWFGGGLLLIIAGLLSPKSLPIPFLTWVMILLIVIPVIYSYRIYRNKLKST